jgi:hypothetical protein
MWDGTGYGRCAGVVHEGGRARARDRYETCCEQGARTSIKCSKIVGAGVSDGNCDEGYYIANVICLRMKDMWVARVFLGGVTKKGVGVDKDETKAVSWYTIAAQQGSENAQFNLGWCYHNGIGVEKDEKEAVSRYS